MVTRQLSEYLLRSMFSSQSGASGWEVILCGNVPGSLSYEAVTADLDLFEGCDWQTLSGDWTYNNGDMESGGVYGTLPYLSHTPPSAWVNDESGADAWAVTYICVAATIGGVRRLMWFQQLDSVVTVEPGDSIAIENALEIEVGGT